MSWPGSKKQEYYTTYIYDKTATWRKKKKVSASCNRGWLKLFTHVVCGVFTVTSFIMILFVTWKFTRIGTRLDDEDSRCQLSGCRVICDQAPFYEKYEDDILLAVMAAETNCRNVFLTLQGPRFVNESLPRNWMAKLQPVVVELGILGGNLHHIPQNAFSAAFARNLKLLFLEEITIASWTQHALLGLANVENIRVKKCNIIDIQDNFLSAVSQTLGTLSVVESGFWDPTNLTGSSYFQSLFKLTSVDFSNNDFGGIIGKASFTRLKFCKSLYLSSSRISYIEPGAFDKLINLEYLNLNDNFLTHLEAGLFPLNLSLRKPKVRLNLDNNLWHCNCSDMALRLLTWQTVLINPPCFSPRSEQGKTLSEFIAYCREKEPKQIVNVDMARRTNSIDEGTSIRSLECVTESTPEIVPTVVSPFHNHPCSVNIFNNSLSKRFFTVKPKLHNTESTFWSKPMIVFQGDNFTMIELSLSGTEGYGLIWYRNSCVNEVFCVNIVPDMIRLYNIDLYNEYTFCPVVLSSGVVDTAECTYVSSDGTRRPSPLTRLILYPLIAVVCLFFGALTLYMLIRKYPHLLKGSKRLLFVKHKTVDALVLPPKVPLRGMQSSPSLDDSKEFRDMSASFKHDFVRSGSVRSSHSVAPSYISALHPTEEQLADWRLKHANETFDNHYATISTISSDTPVSLSSVSDHLYFSIEEGTPIFSITDPFSKNFENKPVTVS